MRRSLKKLLYQGAAAAGSVARSVGIGRSDIAVLIYHSISDQEGSVTVPSRLFRDQVRWIQDHFEIISLDAALDRGKGSGRAVVITFDDGYEDYLTAALPYLAKQGIPSTVYVITELLERPEDGFAFSAGKGRRPLSARQVEELGREELVTVGSHSHRHRRLVGQSAAVLEEELGTSCSVLRELLGRERIDFAFPWGVGDRRAMLETKRYFRSAVVGGSRGNPAPLDPFRIWRIPVKRETLDLFARRVRGDLLLEGTARSIRDRALAARERRVN